MEPVESCKEQPKGGGKIGEHALAKGGNGLKGRGRGSPPGPQSMNCRKSSSSLASSSDLELRLNERLTYVETYSLLSMPVPKPAEIAVCIASLLKNLVSKSPEAMGLALTNTPFDSKTIPGISIEKYLERLAGYSRCSPETFVIAVIYVDRIVSPECGVVLGPRNVHKLFLVALLCAAKFNDDLKLAQWGFAKLGGLGKKELCQLEVQFLSGIDFRVVVSSGDYRGYLKSLLEFGR